MKLLLVSWTLLLFGLSLNSAHYIRRIENGDSRVYGFRDNPSGVTIVNTRLGRPTLRDVLYYHVVERAYGKEEPTVTERSFTNSHGFQFFKDHNDTPSSEESVDHVDDENHEKEYIETNDENYYKHEDEPEEVKENEEDNESATEAKPLTDKDVKEAYKARSYLFDQMRQMHSPVKRMVSPYSSVRRKRAVGSEEVPEGPQLSSTSEREDYIQPKTYGMNLNSDGGYVWNNMNDPPVYYELGQSTGNPNEGQNESGQSQENPEVPVEINVPAVVTESNDSDSLEDIYVSTERQPTKPFDSQSSIEPKEPEDQPEVIESGEPVDNPTIPVFNENSESSEVPTEPVLNDDLSSDFTPGVETPVSESAENPALGSPESEEPAYQKPEEESLDKVEDGSTENAEDEIKDVPEAPTLPPLNYDGLPDYIRDAISSTEKSESNQETENPYINPQLNPEDKKVMEQAMEDIFATAQPVEDIPKTYGMNLTSDSGNVWNDMVNPQVSHSVGSTTAKQEEPKAPETSEEPKQESEEESNPIEEPAQPEKEGEPDIEPANQEDNKEAEFPETTDLEIPENPVQEDNSKPSGYDQPAEPNSPETEAPVEPVVPETPEVDVPEPDSSQNEEILKPEDGANEDIAQPIEPKPEEETDKKPDIMSELLKSEQFWKWLGEWTATYMELLEKHIRKIAIQEICNREKTGSQMCLLDDHSDESELFLIKDGKIIIDGKEIPITHTSNIDNQLKRRDDKDDKGNKVNAKTIYGNSVGNEKVTNVFIFSAENAKEILGELKPRNDTKIDFIVDERIKEGDDSKVNDNIKPEIKEVSEETEIEDEEIDKDKAIEDVREVEENLSSELESANGESSEIPTALEE